MPAIVRYSVGLAVAPRHTLRELLKDPHRVASGFAGLLALATIYIIGISVAIAQGLRPQEALILRIPADQYYLYERLFVLPVAIAETIVTAGVIRLLAQWWHGEGRFEDLFGLLGFSHVVVAVAMGVPDLALALVGRHASGFDIHVVVGTAWYLLLAIWSVKEVEGLPWRGTIPVTLAAMVANGAIDAIFIR